jgi:hypothetical protein
MLQSLWTRVVVVSIPACDAGDPGSIPGRGAFFHPPWQNLVLRQYSRTMDRLHRGTHPCELTNALAPDDPKKFSSATPRHLEDAYLRLLAGGVPTSDRIVSDIAKCMGPNLDRIIEAKGVVVQGLGNRNGLRYEAMGSNHGGRRVARHDFEVPYTHDDAAEARATIFQDSVET